MAKKTTKKRSRVRKRLIAETKPTLRRKLLHTSKKAKGKPASARRAVNIKVNIASKNPMTRKANTPKKKRLWKKIEKAETKRIGKVRAIRAANAAISRIKKNPKRRKPHDPVRRLMRRNPAKMKFIIQANTQFQRYYWVKGNKFTQSRAGAHRFDRFDDAACQAQRQISRASPQVQSIGVERA